MKIYPSNCNTWMRCSAFCKATSNVEQSAMNNNQLEGLALHQVIDKCLSDNIDPSIFLNTTIPVKTSPIIVTDEMISRISPYLKYIENIRCKAKFYGVEFKVQMKSIHPSYKGRIDYFQYSEDTKTLTVVDYKDGWSRVSPIENYTMLSYIIGVLDSFPSITVDNYEIVIYQPRLSTSPNIFKMNTGYVNEARDKIKLAFENALNGPYVERAGKHCKYCNARNTCRSFNNAIETLYTTYQYEPQSENYDIGKRLDFLEHAMAMIKSSLIIETEIAESKIKGGDVIDGWGLKEGRGSWKFKTDLPTESLKWLCEHYHVKAGVFKLFTPNKLSKAGLPDNVLNAVTERIAGKPKLVRVSPEEIKSIFNED